MITLTFADPLFPPLVAVIVALPAETAVTTPADETVATAELVVDQVIGAPGMTFPLASVAVAVSVVVPPTLRFTADGLTETFATLERTVTVAVPLLPSLVAVIVTVPLATPVTSPDPLTVAI